MIDDSIKELFSYDATTGIVRWAKSPRSKIKIGDVAGSFNSDGYLKVQIKGRSTLVHHLVWFLVNGEWPTMIDHIDGNRTNNRIENLRLSSIVLNGQNRVKHRSGHLVGASFNKRNGKWKSQIKINKKRIWLGDYDTEIEAHNAYARKRIKEGGVYE